MANIFFDCDGTILNPKKRMYNLFCELCPENYFKFEHYWAIKSNRISQKSFLRNYLDYTDEQIETFKKNWMKKIEEEARLVMDEPISEIAELLKNLREENNLYIVTNRQNKDLLIKQLENLGFLDFFDKILVTEQKRTKADLVRENVEFTKDDLFIGDSGEDILCAKELGIKSIAVCWGLLNKKCLEEYSPDLVIEEVKELDNRMLV